MLELRLVCLLGTIQIVVGAFGPPAVSVVNAYEISHKLVNLQYKNYILPLAIHFLSLGA